MATAAVTTLRAGTIVAQPDVVEQALMSVFPADGQVALLPLDAVDRGSLFTRCFDSDRAIHLEIRGLRDDCENCIRKVNACAILSDFKRI